MSQQLAWERRADTREQGDQAAQGGFLGGQLGGEQLRATEGIRA